MTPTGKLLIGLGAGAVVVTTVGVVAARKGGASSSPTVINKGPSQGINSGNGMHQGGWGAPSGNPNAGPLSGQGEAVAGDGTHVKVTTTVPNPTQKGQKVVGKPGSQPITAPSQGGAPTQPNAVDVTLLPGSAAQSVAGVGPAGSRITVHTPPAGGNFTSVSVDGADEGVSGGTQTTVTTTRSAGTVLVGWSDASGEHQTAIDYGTPPASSTPQTVNLPAGGGEVDVSDAGLPGSVLTLVPPGPSFSGAVRLESPLYMDGAPVAFQMSPGAQVSVRTAHRSGVIEVGWVDNQTAVNVQVYYGP